MGQTDFDRPLIIALDFPDRESALSFLARFKEPLYVKVGMELFYREGPPFVTELVSAGHRVFLDLKLHDIPVTVERAMRNLAALGADLVNVHAAGGPEMMRAALRGLESGTPRGKKRPLCVAVTQLTSTDESMMKEYLGVSESLEENVLRLAGAAKESGLDGVVCSALESRMVNERFGKDFRTVTPGIRLEEDSRFDQKRVVTPAQANRNKAWAIVAGRGITRAEDPYYAYHRYNKEWRNG
ncbi:orotidine-5'-phosphate decarboxylase [Alteribacter natronophilus]|uniref:orotidine-5'-phosphate decarboxylase n=1 Tax=Alteribacter natronophilus TaxID=2583810 RepID=UPI00110E1D70|nr:orotidine-5'-phosphate decarboxylase [Alteribacter natronophilus]TMW73153.1 orotidine-5'-phosphate decarboxylase [Alteribacter natronophilus]